MQFRELLIADAYEVSPTIHEDARGAFLEWYRADALAERIGHPLDLRQANISVSAAGVLRGIHFADVPPSQAKFVSCLAGAIRDFVVDLRVGSPTFGQWDSVLLVAGERRSVYIAEGLGHAFLSLEDDSVAAYLCSAEFSPEREHGITPLDPEIGLNLGGVRPQLSEKDRDAPTLAEARSAGTLPSYDRARELYGRLTEREGAVR